MASAEMSSSEILQPGSTENLSEPTPQECVTPAEYIVRVDEGVWKRYSSHYEFPLSVLLSLSIHLLAFMVVLAFMSLSYLFGRPATPPIVTFVSESGPGTHPDEQVGGSRGNGETTPVPFGALPELDQPKPDLPEITPPDKIIPQQNNHFDKETGPAGSPGKGKGDGTGIGNKVGPGRGGQDWGRDARWRIRMYYEEPEAFVEQLSNLQVVIAARLNSGRYFVFKNLPTSAPFQYEEMTTEQLFQHVTVMNRLGFFSQDRTTAENFAMGVNLGERPLALLIYIPQDLEKELRDAEEKYHRLPEDKIREKRLATYFDVRREGSRWIIRITKSRIEQSDAPVPTSR